MSVEVESWTMAILIASAVSIAIHLWLDRPGQ